MPAKDPAHEYIEQRLIELTDARKGKVAWHEAFVKNHQADLAYIDEEIEAWNAILEAAPPAPAAKKAAAKGGK